MKKHIETERKYIILMPDESLLHSLGRCTESEITQIYLSDDSGATHRVRRREYADKISYTENIKRRVSTMSVVEEEGEISEQRFFELTKSIAPGTCPVYKKRIAVEYCGRTLEIDIYDRWKRTAVLEIELESEDEAPAIPKAITVIREVTGDKRYSNHSMAHGFPEEII